MTDEDEKSRRSTIEQERLLEWNAYLLTLTADVEKLIERLQAEKPNVWRAYIDAVLAEKRTNDVVWNEVVGAARILFPARTLDQIAQLMNRMAAIVLEGAAEKGGIARRAQ